MTTTWALYRTISGPLLAGEGVAVDDSPSDGANVIGRAISRTIAALSAAPPVKAGPGTWLAKVCCVKCVQRVLDGLRDGLQLSPGDNSRPVYLPVKGAYLAETELVPEAERVAWLTAALDVVGLNEGRALDAKRVVTQARATLMREGAVELSLRNACHHERFYFEYQPLVDLRSGKIASVEALMRIKDGPFGPGEFIPAAERTGLIVPLGEKTLTSVAEQWSRWHDAGYHIPVAVNVSPLQLRDSAFIDHLLDLGERRGRKGLEFKSALELEITEGVALDSADYATLNSLHQRGYRFALDDFGAGAASIRHLLRCPPGRVKFDRDMLLLLTEGEARLEQFKMLVTLVKSRGSQVVVEGIENEFQLECTVRAGADYGQGYYFSRALPPELVPSWLQ